MLIVYVLFDALVIDVCFAYLLLFCCCDLLFGFSWCGLAVGLQIAFYLYCCLFVQILVCLLRLLCVFWVYCFVICLVYPFWAGFVLAVFWQFGFMVSFV